MSTKSTLLTISTIVTKATMQAWSHGSHFGAVPPQIIALDPHARNALLQREMHPQARIVPRRKVTSPVPRLAF